QFACGCSEPPGSSRRGSPLAAQTALVLDLWPALLKLELHVVVDVVTLDAKIVDAQHALPALILRLLFLAFPGVQDVPPLRIFRVLDVRTGGPVAALTADVLQMGRVTLVLEARIIREADRVTDDALAIVLAQRRPRRLDQGL